MCHLQCTQARVYRQVYRRSCNDTYAERDANARAVMHKDTFPDRCTDVDRCTDRRTGMCTDMCTDMHAYMYAYVPIYSLAALTAFFVLPAIVAILSQSAY